MVLNAWKVCKNGVFSSPYFAVFSPNTGKYGTEKTPYLDTFYEVTVDGKAVKIECPFKFI